MKSKFARTLRKWADLIDPQVKPTEGISYNIDARGADPVLTEQRIRTAILAAHNSAISNAVQCTRAAKARNPRFI